MTLVYKAEGIDLRDVPIEREEVRAFERKSGTGLEGRRVQNMGNSIPRYLVLQ